jgi:hypothetical protein
LIFIPFYLDEEELVEEELVENVFEEELTRCT